jgi:hypothetical protein
MTNVDTFTTLSDIMNTSEEEFSEQDISSTKSNCYYILACISINWFLPACLSNVCVNWLIAGGTFKRW